MTNFVEPQYEGRSLSQLMPSVLASLNGETPVIELPVAKKYVVLLVDSLGFHQLSDFADHAEAMGSLLRDTQPLTCSVPSTTATSLTSLGCGVPPGKHGVMGYSFYEPRVGGIINALTWANGPTDLDAFGQQPTIFTLMAEGGRSSAAVTLARFADSALTRLAFKGTALYPIFQEGDRVQIGALVLEALTQVDVVYCYERMLDHDGHGFGVGSWQWLERLGAVDDLVAHLGEVLPADVCLLITGDHGMINVPQTSRLVAEEEPGLGGYQYLGGEPRLRHVYGDGTTLQAAWSSVLGERALVLRREEAVERGWFGPVVTPRSLQRIGDVVAAMRGDFAVMSHQAPGEFNLIGMHGSLTATEMDVPLLALGGRA